MAFFRCAARAASRHAWLSIAAIGIGGGLTMVSNCSPAPVIPARTTGTDRPTFTACPEVSCKSKEELAALFAESYPDRKLRKIGGSSPATPSNHGATIGKGAGVAAAATAVMGRSFGCPPDRDELGRSTWTLVCLEEGPAAIVLLCSLKWVCHTCVHVLLPGRGGHAAVESRPSHRDAHNPPSR